MTNENMANEKRGRRRPRCAAGPLRKLSFGGKSAARTLSPEAVICKRNLPAVATALRVSVKSPAGTCRLEGKGLTVLGAGLLQQALDRGDDFPNVRLQYVSVRPRPHPGLAV